MAELRLVEIPDSYLPEGVSGSAFDPDTLRACAEAHRRHRFAHSVEVKAWVVLYLLDAWEASGASADLVRGLDESADPKEPRVG